MSYELLYYYGNNTISEDKSCLDMIENATLSGDKYDKDVALTHIYYTELDQILFVHDGLFDTILELSQGKNMLMRIRKEKESRSVPSQDSDNLYSSRGICGINVPFQLFLIKKIRSYGQLWCR
jgi:hypothetical protein